MKNNKLFKNIIFIVFLGFIFRLYLLIDFNYKCCASDELTYTSIAKNMIYKGVFAYTKADDSGLWKDIVFGAKPPLYPYFLASFYKFFGLNNDVVKIFQIILSSFTGIFIYLFSEKIFSKKIGLISLIIYNFFWETAYMSLHLLSENLQWFLLSFFILLVVLIKKESKKYEVFAGITLGLLTLNRPTSLIYLLPACFWILYKDFKLRRILSTFVIAIFMVITLIPWTIRNYSVYKQFVFIYTDGGINVWMGNRPKSGGSYGTPSELIQGEIPVLNTKGSLQEIERDKYYSNQARRYLLENPIEAFDTSLRKLLRTFFIFRNDLVNQTYTATDQILKRSKSLAISDSLEVIVSYEYALFLITFFIGLIALIKNGFTNTIFLIFLFLLNNFVIFSSHWEPRYILQMYPMMIPFSAYFLDYIPGTLRSLIFRND